MFTSRLPMSTSVRRPSRPGDGSTSFGAHQRISNIPVTVKKVSLFTPQTKRPYMSGTSTAGKSYVSGLATDKKYQTSSKPVPDRDQQMRMFDTLVDYLKTHAPTFPIPDQKKFFSSVSTTESLRIFEFLIGRILPEFKITKLEKDVPEALGLLKYPYLRSVTKSALVSVTTRQAAAGLLVIFDWLIKYLNTIESSLWDEVEDDDCQNDVQYQLLKNILLEPNYQEANRQLFERLHPLDDVQDKEAQYREMYAELNKINEELAEYEELQQEDRIWEENVAKMTDYRDQMVTYLQKKEEELKKTEQDKETIKIELDDLDKEIDKLTTEIECKNISTKPERRIDLKDPEQTITLFQDDIIPSLKSEIDRTEKEITKLKSQREEKMITLRRQIEEEKRRRITLAQKHEDLVAALTQERDTEIEKLTKSRSETEFVLKENLERLAKVLSVTEHKAETLAKESTSDLKRLQELYNRLEHNSKVLKTGIKMLP